MGLVIPWSFTLALVDGYSVLVKCPIRQPGILSIIIVGDWVCTFTMYFHSNLFSRFSPCLNWLRPNLLVTEFYLLQVLSTLTLAAASSTASVVDLLLNSQGSFCPIKLCCRYRISAALAFVSWFLSLASSLFNLYLLPSL